MYIIHVLVRTYAYYVRVRNRTQQLCRTRSKFSLHEGTCTHTCHMYLMYKKIIVLILIFVCVVCGYMCVLVKKYFLPSQRVPLVVLLIVLVCCRCFLFHFFIFYLL